MLPCALPCVLPSAATCERWLLVLQVGCTSMWQPLPLMRTAPSASHIHCWLPSASLQVRAHYHSPVIA